MTRHVRIARDAQYRDLHDEAVLLHLGTGQCFVLDDIANRIWQLIAEVGDLDRVAAVVSTEYQVEPDVLETELIALVDELKARQLIEA